MLDIFFNWNSNLKWFLIRLVLILFVDDEGEIGKIKIGINIFLYILCVFYFYFVNLYI